MTNNEKSYHIYIRSANKSFPVTKEEYDDFYRDINAYRKRRQRHGQCACPEYNRYMCDKDCPTCPFCKEGDLVSLDSEIGIPNEAPLSLHELITGDSPTPEEVLIFSEPIKALYEEFKSLTPEERNICKNIINNVAERKAAEALNIPRSTYEYRKKILLKKLKTSLEKKL